LPERDAYIFHCVMLIDVKIALSVNRQVETTVFGEQFEHVIEKPNAGGNVVRPLALDREAALDLRLFRDPLDLSEAAGRAPGFH
jgi:hypothetical protein